jgi:hypothetical protein
MEIFDWIRLPRLTIIESDVGGYNGGDLAEGRVRGGDYREF